MDSKVEYQLKSFRKEYEEAIEECKKIDDFYECISYLSERDLELGLCWKAGESFPCTDIAENISSLTEYYVPTYKAYYHLTPLHCYTKDVLIVSLQKRIELIDKILNKNI